MEKMELLFLFLAIIALAYGKPSSFKKPSRLDLNCRTTNTTSLSPNCYVDLTIGIDMSSAMGGEPNIAAAVDQILNFTTNYQQYYTNTAIMAFGDAGIDASDYFHNYEDVCEYIHEQEGTSDTLGQDAKNLSEVFAIYRDKEFNHNRPYRQQVFLIFTGITDETNINNAASIANEVRSQGAQVIVVVFNVATAPTAYSNIADQVYSVPSYDISNKTTDIVTTSCENAGVTHATQFPPVSGSTNSPSNPLSNAIGGACALNLPNAWLDIIVVVDVSKALQVGDLNDIGQSIATVFMDLNIGQGLGDTNSSHTSRTALITYTNTSQIQFDLKSADSNTLYNYLNLPNYATSNDGGNVQDALRLAYNLAKNQTSFRRKAIILIAGTYEDTSTNDATQIADQIKQDQMTLIVVGYRPPNGIALPPSLYALSSPGYSYDSASSSYIDSISLGLAQVNCFCKTEFQQLKLWNQAFNNYTVYADCLQGTTESVAPMFARCANEGVLVSVTSRDKLDFILDNVVTHDMNKGTTKFTVGGKLTNGVWDWSGYNNTVYPFGNFPTISGGDGAYGYFNNTYGFKWEFVAGGPGRDESKPYICQWRACDTDHFC